MKIELSVLDRLTIQVLTPRSGGMIEMAVYRHLLNQTLFSPEERRDLKLTDIKGGGVQWDVSAEKPIFVDVQDCDLKVIKASMQESMEFESEKKGVTMSMLDLLDKFTEKE